MQTIIEINGYATPVEFPDELVPVDIAVEGGRDNWSYVLPGGVTHAGGTITINTGSAGEGSKTVALPFTKLLDFQATAMDNNTGSINEGAHIEILGDSSVRVYAHSSGTSKRIMVKWSAVGV